MNLHDFVKKNYEEGNYDLYKKYYQNKNYHKTYYQNKNHYKKNYQTEDFYMGYNQAFNDYKKYKRFKHYPKKMIYLLNILFKNKAIEILNFINGYLYAKNYIKNNLK